MIPIMCGINITEGFVRHSRDIDRFFLGDATNLEKYKLLIDDLVIGMDGSKVGKNSALISETDVDALLVQRVARLRAKCAPTIRFIFQQINSTKFHAYVDRINTSGGIPHISAKQINDFRICFPSVAEQQDIADCLAALDELIAAQSQKLAALKNHKKGPDAAAFPQLWTRCPHDSTHSLHQRRRAEPSATAGRPGYTVWLSQREMAELFNVSAREHFAASEEHLRRWRAATPGRQLPRNPR
jgi:hypothetical protein